MADSARNTGPPSIQPIKEKQWQFQKRLEEHYLKRGSRYFPFSIEPMQHVRDRLHKPMTAEERALRKQWVQDQILSPNEPRNVPEATPKNIIRRIYRYPWDKIYAGLKPLIGDAPAMHIRIVIPKVLLVYAGAFLFYYHLKYNPVHWTKVHGWTYHGSRPAYFPGEAVTEDVKFDDREFSKRTVYRDYKTSRQGQD